MMAKKRVTPEDDWRRIAERVRLGYEGQIYDKADFKTAYSRWLDKNRIGESHGLRKRKGLTRTMGEYEKLYPYPTKDTSEAIELFDETSRLTRGTIKGRVVSVKKSQDVNYGKYKRKVYRDVKGRFVSVRQKARKKN